MLLSVSIISRKETSVFCVLKWCFCAFSPVLSCGSKGIPQSGLKFRMNIGKLEARMICRRLEKEGVIKVRPTQTLVFLESSCEFGWSYLFFCPCRVSWRMRADRGPQNISATSVYSQPLPKSSCEAAACVTAVCVSQVCQRERSAAALREGARTEQASVLVRPPAVQRPPLGPRHAINLRISTSGQRQNPGTAKETKGGKERTNQRGGGGCPGEDGGRSRGRPRSGS